LAVSPAFPHHYALFPAFLFTLWRRQLHTSAAHFDINLCIPYLQDKGHIKMTQEHLNFVKQKRTNIKNKWCYYKKT